MVVEEEHGVERESGGTFGAGEEETERESVGRCPRGEPGGAIPPPPPLLLVNEDEVVAALEEEEGRVDRGELGGLADATEDEAPPPPPLLPLLLPPAVVLPGRAALCARAGFEGGDRTALVDNGALGGGGGVL